MQLRTSKGQFVKGTHYRPHRVFREKDYLINEYVLKQRCSADIAREHGVTNRAILRWMEVHGIPRRTLKEQRAIKSWGFKSGLLNAEEMSEYNHLRRLAFPELTQIRKERLAARMAQDPILLQKRRDYFNKWRKANPEAYATSVAKHKRLHATRIREQGRKHDKKRKPLRAAYMKKKRAEDINFKLSCALRGRVGALLRGKDKSANTMKLLGCSIESFKLYLESRWQEGMTWENYGRKAGIRCWEIDHEMPCSIFNLTLPEHQRRCFHFSNQQPMWSSDNQSKNAKVVTDQFNLL